MTVCDFIQLEQHVFPHTAKQYIFGVNGGFWYVVFLTHLLYYGLATIVMCLIKTDTECLNV